MIPPRPRIDRLPTIDSSFRSNSSEPTRETLRRSPGCGISSRRIPGVWQQLGNLARSAERAWIELIAQGDCLTAEAVELQLVQLNTNLIGETATPIESLLGDTIVATWLETRYLESISTSRQGSNGNLSQATLLLKRLESAQRRHLAAMKSLMQIRKLLPSAVTPKPLKVFAGDLATA